MNKAIKKKFIYQIYERVYEFETTKFVEEGKKIIFKRRINIPLNHHYFRTRVLFCNVIHFKWIHFNWRKKREHIRELNKIGRMKTGLRLLANIL